MLKERIGAATAAEQDMHSQHMDTDRRTEMTSGTWGAERGSDKVPVGDLIVAAPPRRCLLGMAQTEHLM